MTETMSCPQGRKRPGGFAAAWHDDLGRPDCAPSDRVTWKFDITGSAGGRAGKDQPGLAPRCAARLSGWLMRYRRLVRANERRTEHYEAMTCWATVFIMTRRLAC